MVFQSSKDIIQTDLISFGRFIYQNDDILLLDEISGAKFIIQETQSSFINPKMVKKLYVKKGFDWMNNKFFNQINSYPSQTELAYAKTYKDMVKNTILIKKQKKMGTKKTDAKENYLFTGTYYIGNEPYFLLNLEECGTYVIKFKGINISLGKWNRKNKLLILKDKDVDATFLIEIQCDKLNTKNIIPLSI